MAENVFFMKELAVTTEKGLRLMLVAPVQRAAVVFTKLFRADKHLPIKSRRSRSLMADPEPSAVQALCI